MISGAKKSLKTLFWVGAHEGLGTRLHLTRRTGYIIVMRKKKQGRDLVLLYLHVISEEYLGQAIGQLLEVSCKDVFYFCGWPMLPSIVCMCYSQLYVHV